MATKGPEDGPMAMRIQSALSGLSAFKTRAHKVGRKMWREGTGVLILYAYLKSQKTNEGMNR